MSNYHPAFDIWEVTTEGDCEGRSTHRLGVYTGYIDEIALALASKAMYTLTFSLYKSHELDMTPTREEVKVALDIGIETAHLVDVSLAEYARVMLRDRPVVVKTCCHSYFTIAVKDEIEFAKNRALNKLTAEERKLLGLE